MSQSALISKQLVRIGLFACFRFKNNTEVPGDDEWTICPISVRGYNRHFFYIEDIDSWGNFFETLVITSSIESLREN